MLLHTSPQNVCESISYTLVYELVNSRVIIKFQIENEEMYDVKNVPKEYQLIYNHEALF